MITPPHPWSRACIIALALNTSLPAQAAYQFYMDSFLITKGFPTGTLDPELAFSAPYLKFVDEFDDGGAPHDLTGVFVADQNSNGTGDFEYSSNPATDGSMGPEVAYQGFQDLLSLSSDDAVIHTGAGGALSHRQYMSVRATEDGVGLGRTARFGVAGVFQWIVPELDQSYGIQVQDRRTGIPGDDIISLRVKGLGAGQAEIQIRRSVYEDTNGFAVGTEVIDAITLTAPWGTFVGLTLLHPTADTDQLYGGWLFLDADFDLIAGSKGQFDDPVDIFHGETTGYRGAFFAAEPVPEPETWAMLLAGLGLVGWVAGRRKA